MMDRAIIRGMFAKGKEREVLLFAFLYAHAFDGYSISAMEIQSRFGIPKTTLHRIMEQKWNESGMEMEWKWNKSALIFSKLGGESGTEVERKWNGSGTEVERKPPKKQKRRTPKGDSSEVVRFIESVIAYLNQVTGKRYTTTNANTRKLIKQRFNEGFTMNDFCKVIDEKSEEWMETEMNKYLRPITLFGNKFESYLNSQKVEKAQQTLNFHAKISRNDKYQIAAERAREIDYGTLADIGEKNDGTDAGEENKGF